MKRILKEYEKTVKKSFIFFEISFPSEKKPTFKKIRNDLLLKLRSGFSLHTLYVFLRVEKRCMFARGYLHLDSKYDERA